MRRAAAASACAVVLLVAGCGGGGYGDDLKSASKRFRESTAAATEKMRGAGQDTKRFVDGMDDFQAALDDYRRKLETLRPPRKARAAQARVVTDVQALSADLESLRDALKDSNLPELQRVSVNLQRDGQTVDQSIRALESKAGD